MDLYSMIETGVHVKPELTGEDLAKFADCPIETAQETRTGESARQPVEEVLQTTGETAEKCLVRTTTITGMDKSRVSCSGEDGQTGILRSVRHSEYPQ